MADVDLDEFGDGYAAPPVGRMSRILHLAGTVTSVALVIGMGVWGYRLAVRDVTGVPVVRALEGPMRIAPENPGGEIADHQGLAVNDIASDGTAAPPPERLVLAPRAMDLAEDDVAGLAPLAPPVEDDDSLVDPSRPAVPDLPDAEGATLTAMAAEGAAAPLATEDPALDPTQEAVALALAEALAEGAEPLTDLGDAGGTLETLDGTEVALLRDPALADAFVKKSLRPLPRPAAVAQTGAGGAPATSFAMAPAPEPAEVDPATLAAGTRLIQLGAYDTADEARAEWAKLRARFPDLMNGKALVVQSAESGGRAFFRLRAQGFDGEDDARRFCTALLAENAACIPVAHR